MVQHASASASFAGALAVLAMVASLAWQEKAWRQRPNNLLPQYAFSCLVYSILVFVADSDCSNSAASAVFTFFQMQCRLSAMAMLCCLVLGPFPDWVTRLFSAALWLLPIPLCLAVPPSTLNEVCHRQFSEQQLLVHSVFVTTAFAVMLLLGTLALHHQHHRVTDAQDASSLRAIAPQATTLLERGGSPPESLDIAPGATTPPRRAKARTPGQLPPEAVAAMEASENLILSPRAPAGMESISSQPEPAERSGTDSMASQSGGGSTDGDRLAVCALAIAAKATVVLLLQTCLSWSVYFDKGRVGPSFLQGMLVENFFEHSQGFFLLLLVIGLFDTPLSFFFRRIRLWANSQTSSSRRRLPRSASSTG